MPRELQAGSYEVLFLLAMNEPRMYGYELVIRFKEMSEDHIKVSYGTIYPFLRRMEQRGIIKSHRDKVSGRVYYELTPRGKEAREALPKRIKESRKEWDEKLLGIMAMYKKVFGSNALRNLVGRANF